MRIHEEDSGRLNNMSCFSLATPFHRSTVEFQQREVKTEAEKAAEAHARADKASWAISFAGQIRFKIRLQKLQKKLVSNLQNGSRLIMNAGLHSIIFTYIHIAFQCILFTFDSEIQTVSLLTEEHGGTSRTREGIG